MIFYYHFKFTTLATQYVRWELIVNAIRVICCLIGTTGTTRRTIWKPGLVVCTGSNIENRDILKLLTITKWRVGEECLACKSFSNSIWFAVEFYFLAFTRVAIFLKSISFSGPLPPYHFSNAQFHISLAMNLTERLSVKVKGIKLKSRVRRAEDENPTLEQLVEQFIKAAAKKANLATE